MENAQNVKKKGNLSMENVSLNVYHANILPYTTTLRHVRLALIVAGWVTGISVTLPPTWLSVADASQRNSQIVLIIL